MLVMLAVLLAVLVMVAVMVLELPTVVSGNVGFVGLNTSGACPVLYVLISWGLGVASSVSSTVPFSALAAYGVTVTVTVHVLLAASVLPHVLVLAYCGVVGTML